MNILINLISIKKGGGQQVAINFINQLVKINTSNKVYFLVPKNTLVHRYLLNIKYKQLIVSENSILYRAILLPLIIALITKQKKINVIYTLFGIGIKSKKCISVVGNAYSNIFFPEIKFWNEKKIFRKLFLRYRDKIRLKSSLDADGIVFENKSMMDRAISLFNYPPERCVFIKPSITESIHAEYSDNIKKVCRNFSDNKFIVLVLTGYHKNKNLELIPAIASELKKCQNENIHFTISIDKSDSKIQHIIRDIRERDVCDYFTFIGSVNPLDVQYLYSKIHTVMLLSLLESFSNNIIEAWMYRRPLIISDMEWSRSICYDAALYVERQDPSDIASKLVLLSVDNNIYTDLVSKGNREVSTYPTPKQKVDLQLDFLRKIYALKKNS